jgi:hypothetical protein
MTESITSMLQEMHDRIVDKMFCANSPQSPI